MNAANPIPHLPLYSFPGLSHVPAIPIVQDQWVETMLRLALRACEIKPALVGLSNIYTIDGQQRAAIDFLFDLPNTASYRANHDLIRQLNTRRDDVLTKFYAEVTRPTASLPSPQPPIGQTPPKLTELPLDDPSQFSISWTNFEGIYEQALPDLPYLSHTLTDAQAATDTFWSLLSEHALAYNLLVVQKITPARLADPALGFGEIPRHLVDLATKGQLYGIDLSLFLTLESAGESEERFTPATFTLLQQEPTKALFPIAIWVAGFKGRDKQIYWRDSTLDGVWLYALQAVKASLTVYGIWLGHVYQWHIVTAAMQMTMYNTFSEQHPIYQLLHPQSDYLMAFNNVLMLEWSSIAPPTSVKAPAQFLSLINQFANQRTFLDDDPLATLARQGIEPADFSLLEPWDQYPVVAQFNQVWQSTQTFISSFVSTTYKDDKAVADDQGLQDWLSRSGDPSEGNVAGIPPVKTREALTAVLTSLVYRITIHGVSRLTPSANPFLTFVANYPPCLENSTIPRPDSRLKTKDLLAYLPHTGTIGGMVAFYFTFSFSPPYVPFLPPEGLDADLFFSGDSTEPRNQALIRFRESVKEFIRSYSLLNTPQYEQWPLNIET